MTMLKPTHQKYVAGFILLAILIAGFNEKLQNTLHLVTLFSPSAISIPSLNGSWIQLENIPADEISALLPCERKWIEDASIDKTCGKENQSFSMFTATLGHQGQGCATSNFSSGFLPSWQPKYNLVAEPASIQLLRILRGKVKCFVGDSVTLQFFDAFSHSLKRESILHPALQLTVQKESSSVQVPVNETGAIRGWWGGLKGVDEFSARMSDWSKDEKTIVRWYKHYVWSPWDVSLMEDCDVITFNLALHYKRNGNWPGRNSHPYVEDVQAAIDFLSNFTASKPNRVAIWRETLPQHFKTETGSYSGSQPTGCGLPIKHTVKSTQGYNQKTRAQFEAMCDCVTDVPGRAYFDNGSVCFAYECVMDHTANVSYESVHSWQESNHFGRKHSGTGPSNERSRVYWWFLFDVFDVPSWHSGDRDCTHFCFIPQAYEIGWLRLLDILKL